MNKSDCRQVKTDKTNIQKLYPRANKINIKKKYVEE